MDEIRNNSEYSLKGFFSENTKKVKILNLVIGIICEIVYIIL